MEISDKSEVKFLSDYLLNYNQTREIFNVTDTINTIIVSIDDIFSKLIISNDLYEILRNSDISDSDDFKIAKIGDILFNYEQITEFIFKIIINDTVQYYSKKDYESNLLVKIPDTEIAISNIKELCAELCICCAIYDVTPRKNFEPININYSENNEDKFKFIELIKYNGKTKADKWQLKSDKLYVNCFKDIHWTNYNRNKIDKVYLRKIFKFRWYKLMLPISIYDNSINIPYLTSYIWKYLEERMKLRINLDIIHKGLMVFPLQLAGTSNHVLFRHKLKGSENWLHNWNVVHENSTIQWTKNFNYDLYNEIFKLINYDYNYIGTNIFEKSIRNALIYCTERELTTYNFPENISIFENIIKKKTNREKLDIWINNTTNKINEKAKFIDKYLNII